MSRLYVIGNGFDCYAHTDIHGEGMKTKYIDFRKYLMESFENSLRVSKELNIERDLKPFSVEGKLSAYKNTEEYIIDVLDKSDKYWNSIEEAIGSSVFNLFKESFDECKQTRTVYTSNGKFIYDNLLNNERYYNNETIAEEMRSCFVSILYLFEEWVFNELGAIDYSLYMPNTSVQQIFKDGGIEQSYFLTFNYTLTLEKIYNISDNKINHIHGKTTDMATPIVFGHGVDTLPYSANTEFSFESVLNELHMDLKKETKTGSLEYWLDDISNITEIYSYGFSFSDADFGYIKEIAYHLNLSNPTWFLNTFDYKNNPHIKEKLKNLGFKVKQEKGW